jgi:signal transduction histidine kinase
MQLIPDKWLPRTLAGRMAWVMVLGLLAAQIIGLQLHLHDRAQMMAMMSATDAQEQMRGHMMGGYGYPGRYLWQLLLTLAMLIAVALVAVRWVTKPLQQMAEAANAFASDLEAAPLRETGPAEVQDAARAFNLMQRKVRQLVLERGHALAAVSHDLRTPLTRMRLRAELVDNAALRGQINADVDSMQAMVESVLTYLRGVEEDQAVQPINMQALVSSIVEDASAMGHPVTLADSAAPATVAPAPYPGRLQTLRRAIANLVDNGVAYGKNVSVSLVDTPLAVTVVVEDDGPGIDPKDLQRAVEPFVRLDPARIGRPGGFGLGLAIARDAAACHGGKLVLENRSSGGLRARLELPKRSTQPGSGQSTP